ncbi:HalOD1 output domain-containing protein [Haloarculaceae archaeon H-GB2-1]|nr:hypothetical protein [Haloarculaceae archaeon H-GB1-1]MEA5387306.1 HalOD1 output domain-containing protein [Haloarculaceae archaeon H-GB11]MEA5408772.1 HalOD1 output domain-containing protein [Haloarculaceae archaeon H-GB2-1]
MCGSTFDPDDESTEPPEGNSTYVFEREPTEFVSDTVVRAVSNVTGDPAVKIPPLARRLDPDALDTLFDRPDFDGDGATPSLAFVWHGCALTVNGDSVSVSPIDTSGQTG